jgi:hypothetical protein
LAVGITEKALPVPILVPAVASVYYVIVPVAQVALRVIGVPKQVVGLLAETVLGAAGVAFTVTKPVVPLVVLLPMPLSQAAK